MLFQVTRFGSFKPLISSFKFSSIRLHFLNSLNVCTAITRVDGSTHVYRMSLIECTVSVESCWSGEFELFKASEYEIGRMLSSKFHEREDLIKAFWYVYNIFKHIFISSGVG